MQPNRMTHPREILPLRLMLGAAADQIVAGPSGGQRPELVFDALQYLPLLGRELSGSGLLDAQEQSLVHRKITAESVAGTSSDGIQGIVSRAFGELRNKTTPPEGDPQAEEIRAQIRAYLDREGVESLDQALQHTVVEKTLQKEMGAFRSVVAGLAEGSPGRAKLLETSRARLLKEIPQDLFARYLALRRFDSIDDLLAAHARQAEFDREPVSMLRQNDALAFVAGPSTAADLFDPNVDWIGEAAQAVADTSTPQGLISTIDAFLESDRALRLAGSPEELALWKSWWNPSNQGPNLSLRAVLIDRMALHDWDKNDATRLIQYRKFAWHFLQLFRSALGADQPMDKAGLAKHRSAVITVLGSAAEDFKGVCETGVHNRIRELQASVDQVLSIQSRNPLYLVQLTARGLRRQLLHQATIAMMPRAARFIDQFGAEVDNEHAKSVVNHALNRPLRLGYAAGELHYSEEFDRPNENWMNAHHPGWQSELARRVDPTETPKKGTTVYDPTALDPLLKDLVRNLEVEGRIEHVVQILADFYEQELRAGRAPHFARPEDQEAFKKLHQAFVQVAQSKASLDEVMQEVARLRDALEARGLETGFLPPTNRRELMLEELARHDWQGLPAEALRAMPDVLQRLRAPSQQSLQQQVVSILEGDRRAKGEWRADLANIRRQLEQLETTKRETAAGLDEAGLAALDEQIKQVDKQRKEFVGHLYRLEDRGAAFRAIQPLLAQWDKNPASFDQLVRSRLQTRASDQHLQQVLVRMDARALRDLLLSENRESLSPFGIHMLGAYGGIYQTYRVGPKGDLFGWASAEAEAQVAQSMPIDLGQMRAVVDQAIEMGDIRSIPTCYWNALKPFWMELTAAMLGAKIERKELVSLQLPASIQQGMLDRQLSEAPEGPGRGALLMYYAEMFPEGIIKQAATYVHQTLWLLRDSTKSWGEAQKLISYLPDRVQQALLPYFIEATNQASDDSAWKACSLVANAGYEKAVFDQWPQELQRQYLSWFYQLCADPSPGHITPAELPRGARPMAEKHLDLLMPHIPAFSKTASYHATSCSRNLLEKVSDGLWEAEWAKPVSGASVIRAYIDMFAGDRSRMEHLADWYDRQHQPDSAQMIRYLLVSRGSAPWTDVSEVPITPLLDDIMNSHSILGSREWPSPVAVRAWLTRQLEQNPLYLTAEADKLDDAQSLKTFWHHLAAHPDLLIPYLGPQLTSSKAQTLLRTLTRKEDLQKALSKMLEIPREVLKTIPVTVIPLLMQLGKTDQDQVFAHCPELQSAATIREYIPAPNLYDLASHLWGLKEEDRFMPLIEAQITKALEQQPADGDRGALPDDIRVLAGALTAGHYPISVIKKVFDKFLLPNPAYVSKAAGQLLFTAADNLHPEAVQLVLESGLSPYQIQEGGRTLRLPIQCLKGAIGSWNPPEKNKRAEAVQKLLDAAYDRDYPIASLESSFDYRPGLLLLGFVREGNVPAHALFGLAKTNRSAADLEERWELLTKKLLTPKALKILQDNIDRDFTKERVLGILNEAKALVERGQGSSSSEQRSGLW